MKEADEGHVTFLEQQVLHGAPFQDIMEIAPELSNADAYRLQFALMRRRIERGDALVGYKAAYTNFEIQRLRGRSMMMGSILSCRRSTSQ